MLKVNLPVQRCVGLRAWASYLHHNCGRSQTRHHAVCRSLSRYGPQNCVTISECALITKITSVDYLPAVTAGPGRANLWAVLRKVSDCRRYVRWQVCEARCVTHSLKGISYLRCISYTPLWPQSGARCTPTLYAREIFGIISDF